MSGSASVRRFNAALTARYKLKPTQLRRAAPKTANAPGITVRLGYRPPYDVAAMPTFMEKRHIHIIENGCLRPQMFNQMYIWDRSSRQKIRWLATDAL